MIKKNLTLLAIPLLLCSCGVEKVYKNLPYEFDMDKHTYVVMLFDNGEKVKEWNVSPEHVYFIQVKNYDIRQELVQDEFYIKGNSYKLYVYNYR